MNLDQLAPASEEIWLSLDSLYDAEGWLIDAKQPVPKWLKELITKAEKEIRQEREQ